MSERPPDEVTTLARQRAAARSTRDFAAADALRDRIAAAGWVVRDTADGFTLAPAPPHPVLPTVRDLPDRSSEPDSRRASVAVVITGWPQDVRAFGVALLDHTPADVVLLGLDVGNVDGAGAALHELHERHPLRVEEHHVERPAGWAEAVSALARADTAAIHVMADLSTVFEEDALGPILAAFDDPGVVGAGWRGVDVSADWLSFVDAPAGGPVEAVLGYLFAVRRAALLAVPPHPKARFYRNADLELSYALRGAGLGRLVVPAERLPIRQGRHHGYHDTDPAYRERESKRTYDRFLARFRGRDNLRLPR